MADDWLYYSGYCFRSTFPDLPEVVREEVPLLTEGRMIERDPGETDSPGIKDAVECQCLYCREPFDAAERQWFCSDECLDTTGHDDKEESKEERDHELELATE